MSGVCQQRNTFAVADNKRHLNIKIFLNFLQISDYNFCNQKTCVC